MELLNRDAILAANDHRTERVEVPEWGGAVLVATMSGRARDEWETSLVSREGGKVKPNTDNVRARLVALTVVDSQGKRVFSAEDVMLLGEKSAAALTRIASVAQRLNGLTDSDLEDLKGN